jgi:hypothetical protein
MADTVSAHSKVTVTSALFQPWALASGVSVHVIVGGVVS